MFLFKKERLLHIGIVGLGLMGGSMAKALKKYTPHFVYGCDVDEKTMQAALADGEIDEPVYENDLSMCDLVFLALYPRQAVRFVTENLREFKPGAIIVDFCGVKRFLVDELEPLCKKNDLIFIGGHPMAGREFWGYSGAQAELFQGASMILTPTQALPPEAEALLTTLFADVGFSKVVQTTPRDHDAVIAFTSQLAHVLSSAYVKSPQAKQHHGFSAGSYKDLSRVAKLNPQMWTELFLENSDLLVEEIEILMEHLSQYKEAIAAQDAQQLYALLEEGRKQKEELDLADNIDTNKDPLFHLH